MTGQVEVLPGRHVVAVEGGVVVVVAHRAATPVTATSPAWTHANAVLDLVRRAAADEPEHAGRAFARLATTWLMGSDEATTAEFGVLTPVAAGVAIFLHGGISAVLGAEERTEILRGRDAGFTVDRVVVPLPPVGIGLFVDEPAARAENLPMRGVFGLTGGTVPGRAAVVWEGTPPRAPGTVPDSMPAREEVTPPRATGVALVKRHPPGASAAGARDSEASQPDPARRGPGRSAPARPGPVRSGSAHPAPASSEPGRSGPGRPPPDEPDLEETIVPAAARPAQPASGVMVAGYRCSRRHLNDPRASFCALCGIRLDRADRVLTDGPRPPLGVLLLDDGRSFVLDRDLVLGREPEYHEAVTARGARAIRLTDPSGGMSRAHAEIRLVDWNVTVVDGGSTNGTHLRPAGHPEWARVAPGRPIPLAPGTQLLLGGRVLTFDTRPGSP